MKKYLQFKFIELIPEKGPWAALLLIPVTIISGAYWNSIPFYLVIATLWLFQSKSPIPWETGITLMGTTLLAVFIVSKTDYTFWIYSIKIIGCFVIIVTLRPTIRNHQRMWLDMFFVSCLWFVWANNSYFEEDRLTFDIIGNRHHPNFTAVYCYLFAMLAVRWRLPLSLLVALTMGWLTGSRNFALALSFVTIGYILFPILRWILSKTSRTTLLYLFLAGFTLWVLEQVTTGQLPGLHLFEERILNFTADSTRLNWNLDGLHKWTESLQSFAWGSNGWPLTVKNPHHALLHTLVERGLVVTSAFTIFLMSDVRKHARGMEPWILGWFFLGMFVHLIFISMYWVIALLILRCRYVRNGAEIQEDALVEWVLLKWNIFSSRKVSS